MRLVVMFLLLCACGRNTPPVVFATAKNGCLTTHPPSALVVRWLWGSAPGALPEPHGCPTGYGCLEPTQLAALVQMTADYRDWMTKAVRSCGVAK